jgi:hypothetical protein
MSKKSEDKDKKKKKRNEGVEETKEVESLKKSRIFTDTKR